MTTDTTRAGRRLPAAVRRPVVALRLSDLHGPAGDVIEPPRTVWWSGAPVIDLRDRGQAVLFYDQLLDSGTSDDIAAWANGDLLLALWPAMGGRAELRRAWEATNPQLAVAAARAA